MGFQHFRVLVWSGISYRSVPESLFKMGSLRTVIFYLIKNEFLYIIGIFTECSSWMKLGFLLCMVRPRVSNLKMEIGCFDWCFLRFLQHLYNNSWILLYDKAQPRFHFFDSCSTTRMYIMNYLLEKMPFTNPRHHNWVILCTLQSELKVYYLVLN
jgi:hypothetical protein